MKESILIGLSPEFITSFQDRSVDRQELLYIELGSQKRFMEDLLNNFYYEQKGKISGIILKADSIRFVQETSGCFTLNYTINYTDGCRDINYCEKSEMSIFFEIDQEHKLKLSTETVRERMPDEF